jgi:hypothetical protein
MYSPGGQFSIIGYIEKGDGVYWRKPHCTLNGIKEKR